MADCADGAAPMDVDGAHGELLGPEQHAAIRSGVFWCDRPGSQLPDSLPGDQQQVQQESGSKRRPEQGSQQAGDSSAVSTGAAVSGAAAAAVGQPAEGSYMYGGGGGTVLLFEAGNPCPQGAWLLPRWAAESTNLSLLPRHSLLSYLAFSGNEAFPLKWVSYSLNTRGMSWGLIKHCQLCLSCLPQVFSRSPGLSG